MPKLICQEATKFKKCIEAITNLVEEGVFKFRQDGLYFKATDPSQIAMIEFTMPKDAFEVYEFENQNAGIDLRYFLQILSRARAKEKLILELSESTLHITFSNKTKRTFKIPLLDIAAQELPDPKIEFTAKAKLNAGLIQDALKDASLITTHVLITLNPEGLTISANSNKGETSTFCSKENLAMLETNSQAVAMFPLDYLQNILKAAPADSEITLSLATDAPLKVAFSLNQAKVVYYLAPRIEG